MKTLLSTLCLFSVSAFAESWTGTVVDAKCGLKHADASEASRKCVEGCIKGGSAVVFAVDGKIFKLANPDAVKAHYGHKIVLDGTLDKDTETITVKSAKMAE
ncbi:MAG: hypothetical protein K2Q23_10165 [Bryobacteraceae bacterium]|nr:hypothetical protein [Bryobacteraceae bacterium]